MRRLTVVCRGLATGVAVVAVATAPAKAAPTPTPTPTSGNTFVEVTPNTTEPGGRVNLRASCDDANSRQATVDSEAFGRVVLRPDNGLLTGAVSVPGDKAPGSYPVNLNCNNGNTASTTLTVLNMSKPSQGPATGGGGTAGGPTGWLVLAGGIAVLAVGAGFGLSGLRRRGARTG
jgi:hypothetical protein